ncbi:MAG: NADP-dependent isocitrate dehydrogenase, partial [Paenibacillaceae bacterium]|nr:NADP-dependent isocitrate dehydrogenase [Paenibacillaceae bacterium]
SNNRKKVTLFVKDNIMKMTDGLYSKIFADIGSQYPDIEKEHWIVDIGAAKLADAPQQFDVIVTLNLYGDILSDVAAQISGSVGLAGSANIGDHCAMFEAIHGSAPRRAGMDLANPSGLLQGAVLMLQHIGQCDVATRVHNAWLKTLEDGIHTYDIYQDGTSKSKVGTQAFADAVIERLGQTPVTLKTVQYTSSDPIHVTLSSQKTQQKVLHGVDIFVNWDCGTPEELGKKIEPITAGPLKLQVITNRGVKVYPGGFPETFCTDHWRCRFFGDDPTASVDPKVIVALYAALLTAGFDCIKMENLYSFDGVNGFSGVHG